MGGLFRAAFFSVAVVPRDMAAVRGMAIQLAFRIAIGGLWGSLAQSFRVAEPAWLAGLLIAVIVPAGVHSVEYAFLRAGHAIHIRTAMIISVGLSIWFLAVELEPDAPGTDAYGQGSRLAGD